MFAILALIILLRFEGRRKRILANRIPGPNGLWLIGMLPLLFEGPENIIKEAIKYYRK